jgi:hypothetical protein
VIRVFSAIVLTLALSTLTYPAHAVDVGIDLGGTVPLATGKAGLDAGLRLGAETRVAVLDLTTEMGARLLNLNNSTGGRFEGGARLKVVGLLQPGIFAHVGYGDLGGISGLSWDTGGLVDIALIPALPFGVHVGYNRIEGAITLEWMAVGAHLDIRF